MMILLYIDINFVLSIGFDSLKYNDDDNDDDDDNEVILTK